MRLTVDLVFNGREQSIKAYLNICSIKSMIKHYNTKDLGANVKFILMTEDKPNKIKRVQESLVILCMVNK